MASFKKSTLTWCLAAAVILLAFGGLMAFVLIQSSKNGQPTPNAPTHSAPSALNPDVPASRPDSFLEKADYSFSASNNYESEVKKSQNLNTRKPEGRMRPLDSFVESDSDTVENSDLLFVFPETTPEIDEKMLAVLSSLVSKSHPNTESKTATDNILDYEVKMTDLLASIVSQETSSAARQDMLNTLSVIVSEHGTDSDIKEKMSNVLHFLVNEPSADQKLKGEMATVMARILSQDVDEAITWKMLNILQKIASQEKDLDVKSKLLTVFSAIIRQENSIGLQLKTANVLSTIIHQHGIDETRSKMVRLLSTIVPPVQKAESRAKSDDQYTHDEYLDQHLKITKLFQKAMVSETQEADLAVISGMLNAMSVAMAKEKATEVASPSIKLESTSEPLEQSRMTTSMNNVLSGVVSDKHHFGKTATENTESGADLENRMADILSKISADKKQTPMAKFDEDSETVRMYSRLVNDEEFVELCVKLKGKIAEVLSTLIEERKAPEADSDFKAKMDQIFLTIMEDDMVPDADSDVKAKMDDVLSAVVNKNEAPEPGLDLGGEMAKLLSNLIDEGKSSKQDLPE